MCTLEDLRVPEVMVNLLRSLHDGMKAKVTVSNFTSPLFSVTNGVELLHRHCLLYI